MKVKDVHLSLKSEFMKDYLSGTKRSERFFDYTYVDRDRFKKRADELLSRSFQREQLADYFKDVHQGLPYNEEANRQIEKLRNEQSVVVVGGQQAGLLTGPLYTVYKAMSIIILAKQQEEQLNIPVVPIFWIAGEDHDLDEIRFVYKEINGDWQKHLLSDKDEPQPATVAMLDKSELKEWLRTIFATLPETAYTNELISKTENLASESTTYVDFFLKMMNWIFGKEGLLLLDAHSPALRKLEINYFERLILNVDEVQLAQQRGAKSFLEEGYGEPIQTEPTNAHLFLEINKERKRLNYEDERFLVSGSDLSFSKHELIELLHNKPEWFSNNVVTRPIMQEWLLPVLAFISGPGELLYWATLKEVFHHFKLKIPPIAPRYEATFIPSPIGKWLTESSQPLQPFLEGKMEELREAWFQKKDEYRIDQMIEEVKTSMFEKHAVVRNLAKELDPTLAVLSEKNAAIIDQQLNFIGKKMDNFVRQRYEHVLSKFTETGHWVFPLDQPQERVFHPILLINIIGIDEFRRFLSADKTLDGVHKAIFL